VIPYVGEPPGISRTGRHSEPLPRSHFPAGEGWRAAGKTALLGFDRGTEQALLDSLLGMRLPRSSVGGPITPGRALVHLGNGELLTVQVPLD